ncbi:MAG TPA: hypothetical protein PKI62_01205, partial [bacterium]|nr:hypothetical protein [bacterium]
MPLRPLVPTRAIAGTRKLAPLHPLVPTRAIAGTRKLMPLRPLLSALPPLRLAPAPAVKAHRQYHHKIEQYQRDINT